MRLSGGIWSVSDHWRVKTRGSVTTEPSVSNGDALLLGTLILGAVWGLIGAALSGIFPLVAGGGRGLFGNEPVTLRDSLLSCATPGETAPSVRKIAASAGQTCLLLSILALLVTSTAPCPLDTDSRVLVPFRGFSATPPHRRHLNRRPRAGAARWQGACAGSIGSRL